MNKRSKSIMAAEEKVNAGFAAAAERAARAAEHEYREGLLPRGAGTCRPRWSTTSSSCIWSNGTTETFE